MSTTKDYMVSVEQALKKMEETIKDLESGGLQSLEWASHPDHRAALQETIDIIKKMPPKDWALIEIARRLGSNPWANPRHPNHNRWHASVWAHFILTEVKKKQESEDPCSND